MSFVGLIQRSGNLAYVICGLEQNTERIFFLPGGLHVDALLFVFTLEVVFRSECWCNGALSLLILARTWSSLLLSNLIVI